MPRPRHVRTPLAAVLAGAFAAAVMTVGAAAAPAPPAQPGPPAQPAPPAPHAAPVRYRPVGCRLRRSAGAVSGGPHRREVALTFDDGPWSDTPQFLSALERLRVRATFFMIGQQVMGHSAQLARELRDGDVLGNHTFTHPYLTRTGDVAGQLSRTSAAIERASGYRPCLFRPPYGAIDPAVVRTAQSQGLATIMWNDDPRDWSLPSTGAIVSGVLSQARPGSIVIMHEGGGPRGETLAALPLIVRGLRARGLRPVSLLELLGGHTVYRRCRAQCGGLGVRPPLPPGSVIQ